MDAMATGRAAACRPDGAGPVGIYKPRRPQASPLFRLVADQFRTLQMVYDERFAPKYGAWRAVVPEVADKFLACGVLEHGFARVRCDACAHEYLLAFSCKARYFFPSCHAKRSRCGRSGWRRRSSRLCRTGKWCSLSRSGSAPGVCTDAQFSSLSRVFKAAMPAGRR